MHSFGHLTRLILPLSIIGKTVGADGRVCWRQMKNDWMKVAGKEEQEEEEYYFAAESVTVKCSLKCSFLVFQFIFFAFSYRSPATNLPPRRPNFLAYTTHLRY